MYLTALVVCQFEKGVLKDLEISGTGLVVHETVRMLGQVCCLAQH